MCVCVYVHVLVKGIYQQGWHQGIWLGVVKCLDAVATSAANPEKVAQQGGGHLCDLKKVAAKLYMTDLRAEKQKKKTKNGKSLGGGAFAPIAPPPPWRRTCLSGTSVGFDPGNWASGHTEHMLVCSEYCKRC